MIRAARRTSNVNRVNTLKPLPRKVWLTAHVALSVGWFGGAYAMLVIAIVALTSAGTPLRHDAYELVHVGDTAIMIPGGLGALVTGLVVGLWTRWRVLHHWWVVVKLLLTVGGMAFAYAYLAQNVETALLDPRANLADIAPGIVAGSVVMVLVLLTTTLVSITKPWGRTAFGRRVVPALTRRRG